MRAVDELSTCSYTTEAFSDLLGKIQAAVRHNLSNTSLLCPYVSMQIDRLNLEGYANLDHWVGQLDQKIEDILLQRLTHIIQVWCTEFDRVDDADRSTLPLRDITNKRRGDKRLKEEKVSPHTSAVCLRFQG